MSVKITPLTKDFLPSVAALHLNNLRTSYRGYPGLILLELYYSALIDSNGGCGFVAMKDGAVAGYVCGIWEPSHITQTLLKKSGGKLIYWTLREMLISRNITDQLISKITSKRNANGASSEIAYELRPIVVAPEARGSGIGALLVAQLIDDATTRKYSSVFLETEMDNYSAQKLYERAGFEKVNNFVRKDQSYIQYKIGLMEF